MPWKTLRDGRKVFIAPSGRRYEEVSNPREERQKQQQTKWEIFEEEREKTAQQIYGKKFNSLSASRQSNVEVLVARQHYRQRTGAHPEHASQKRLDKISNQHYKKDFTKLNKYQQDTVQIEELNTRR